MTSSIECYDAGTGELTDATVSEAGCFECGRPVATVVMIAGVTVDELP